MKQGNKQGRKSIPQKKVTAKAPPAPIKERKGMLLRLEEYFHRRRKFYLILGCILTAFFAILLFDVKMSNANDDSTYVNVGWKVTKDIRAMYNANAPLYPLFLSVPISIFGLKIILLKSLSVIFILLHIVLLYYAFRNRVNNFVLMMVLLTTAVNSYFLYFASMTFNEAFFLALQSLFFLLVFRYYDSLAATTSLRETWYKWLMIGFMALILSMAKNVALMSIVALVIFLLWNKKYLQACYAAGSFLIFKAGLQVFNSVVLGNTSQYTSQSKILFQIDPYNPSKGMETLSGFIDRFFRNGNLYLSRRLFQILGFQSEDSTKVNGYIVFFCAILFLLAVIYIIKNKDKVLLFLSIYVTVMLATTFTVLQVQWDQPRLVMVFVPLILLTVYGGWNYLLKNKNAVLQLMLVAVVFVTLITGLLVTLKKSSDNYTILKRNLSGDIYYGYTPDWVNYLKMSAWCGDSLPEGSLVGARKAPMSFIYAKGKPFYGIDMAFSSDADTILTKFKNDSVTHVLMASLRRNPKQADGYVINTIQRLLYPVMQKYPGKLALVKQIGETEPAYLYKINY